MFPQYEWHHLYRLFTPHQRRALYRSAKRRLLINWLNSLLSLFFAINLLTFSALNPTIPIIHRLIFSVLISYLISTQILAFRFLYNWYRTLRLPRFIQ